jgi:predicted TPR repeat methyltransferase
VQQLFDSYAADFDAHLQRLDYRAPQQLALLLQPHALQWRSALDLGCGTGQCGPLLRPWVQALHGVDLSSRMLDEARARGLYDTLHHADIATHLARTEQRHDLLVAADVCIYLGDLAPLMAGARRVLQPGGLLALSLEAADDSVSFTLRPSARYAHSARYLRALAAEHGLQVLQLQPGPLRTEQRQPVPGLYGLLQQPLSPAPQG